MGLSIVAAVVAAHGGTVVITSRPGGGLDVTARPPRSRHSHGPEAAVSPDGGAAGQEAGATEIDFTSR
ncbi:ATP-binding protein [Parafrankia sp. EAN1pec]|uniref:ATP-binding protein n=1 Tax=Parafrankia sp. (strain EAN1pec) TaxID=298653 RepID=UPI003219F795